MTTIQLTLTKDDLNALEDLVIALETTPDLVALATHILEQVKLKEMTA